MNTALSTFDLSPKKRKLLFRAWHRGIKEMDLILGSFVDAQLPSMSDAHCDEFEMILELNDHDLLKWVTGKERVPIVLDTLLFKSILSHVQT
jgi:antitoxin CptB